MDVDESKTETEKPTSEVTVKEEKEKEDLKADKETKEEDKIKKEVCVDFINLFLGLIGKTF